MGLNDKPNNGNKIYLNIVAGKITRRFKQHLPEVNGKPVTFDRDIKDDDGNVTKTVIERYHDSIDGLIVNAEIDKTGGFGAMLVFTIQSDEEYTLSVPLESSYGRAILKRIPNIDPNKELEFAPFNFESKDEIKNGKPKKIVGCNVFQKDCEWDKDKVPMKWTQENPGSLPQWRQSETTGKWDNTEELEFLGAHFLQWAKKVGGISIESSVVENLSEAIDDPMTEEENTIEGMTKDAPDPLSLETKHAEKVKEGTEQLPPTADNGEEVQPLPF